MSGVIEAESIGSQNGQIVLYAEGSNAVPNNVAANKGQKQGTSEVLVSGTLDASGYGSGQTGGNISVLGDHVGILSGSLIDASGDAGGGTIKIGGDFHGQGTTPTALNTVVIRGRSSDGRRHHLRQRRQCRGVERRLHQFRGNHLPPGADRCPATAATSKPRAKSST